MSFDLSDYTPVNERIRAFMKAFPAGIIQTSPPQPVPGRDDLLMVEALVYRLPDDQRPVRAWATELVNGRTSFTRNREVENASTSAVGRALGYMGIGIDRGLASLDEIVNREETTPKPQIPPQKVYNAPLSVVKVAAVSDVDPWAEETPAAPEWAPDVPECEHGARVWKEGTSKTGKPWSAYMCTAPKGEACEPLWRT